MLADRTLAVMSALLLILEEKNKATQLNLLSEVRAMCKVKEPSSTAVTHCICGIGIFSDYICSLSNHGDFAYETLHFITGLVTIKIFLIVNFLKFND